MNNSNCNKSRRSIWSVAAISVFLFVLTPSQVTAKPPFEGTVWVDKDIIRASDPTTFVGLTYVGRRSVEMFDRRIDQWKRHSTYYFEASFSDGISMYVAANPEYGSAEDAQEDALLILNAIGRLPTFLRKGTKGFWLHKNGAENFGGNLEKNVIDAYGGFAQKMAREGYLEEILLHETVHTTLDARHLNRSAWRRAQNADPEFISVYAADHPLREDLAESFPMYFALVHRPSRISQTMRNTIEQSIPNRLAYLAKIFPAETAYFQIAK